MLKIIEENIIDNHEMLYKIASKYLKNHNDVLDALQETAFKAIKNSNKLKEEEYALTWIVRILINNCLQTIRKKKQIVIVELNEEIIRDNSTQFESNIEISDILCKINQNYRDVIVLKYIEGYKIREIAKIYKKPESTIKTWLRRGLESIGNEVDYD